MEKEIAAKIGTLEDFLGIPVRRVELFPSSIEPHDETFANLCHRFYGQEHEIEKAITLTTKLLLLITAKNRHNSHALTSREISILFSILGTLYYLKEQYDPSIGCFMKALSWYRDDMVPWIELMFSIRAAEDYGAFESIILHLEGIHELWKNDTSPTLDKEKLTELINKAVAKNQ